MENRNTQNENLLFEKSVPRNIQTISDSVMSFEDNNSTILDVIGKKFETDASGRPSLEGMKAISKAMEIYSDKHYETARYLFVKDGTITRHITVSSQTPSSTIIKPDDRFLYSLKSYAQETNSQIVFLHNHPSGYVEPSEADINLTNYMANFFSEQDGSSCFAGHIILDHGTFGLYSPAEKKWNAIIDGEIYPISEIEKTYKIQLTKFGKKATLNSNDYSISTQSLIELSEFAKKCDSGNLWNKDDWISGFMLTGNGIVTSLEHFNIMEFQDKGILSQKLKEIGRQYGSENIVLFPSSMQQFLICERFAQDTGKVKDIFYNNPDGGFEVSQFNNGTIFNDLRADEIKIDDTIRYSDEVNKKLMESKEDLLYNKSVNKTINSQKMENKTMAHLSKEEIQDLTGEELWKNFNGHMDAQIGSLIVQAHNRGREDVLIMDFEDAFNSELYSSYTQEQRDFIKKRLISEAGKENLSDALLSFKDILEKRFEEGVDILSSEQTVRQMHDTMYHSSSWSENFPNVFSNVIYKEVKRNAELENLRLRAKAGDRDAADELVRKTVDSDVLQALRNKFPDAIVAPVIAEEASGNNQIPYAYANILRENGFELDSNIVQSVRAHHTGANSIKRLTNRVRFDGEVQKGRDYILIDDHVDSGGTLRDFKDYVEANGGKVVAFSSLTAVDKNIKISPTKENLEILNQYGGKVDELLEQYGITDNKQGLTNSEVTELVKLFSDKNRNREFENESQKRFFLLCQEIGDAHKAELEKEKRTAPVLNRFVNLTKNLPQEEQNSLKKEISEISEAIKNENSDVINLINSFNRPEYSKKSPDFSQDILCNDIKNVLINNSLSFIDQQGNGEMTRGPQDVFPQDAFSQDIFPLDEDEEYERYKKENTFSEEVNRRIDNGEIFSTYEDIEKEATAKEKLSESMSKFDIELQDFIDGKLPKSHVFTLGEPSEILQKCGFPANQRIEMSASHLEFKSKLDWQPFDMKDVMGLEEALKSPVAVFEYGDRKKSQNVIVNIEKYGKNFLTGIHFNQATRGYEVSDIRTLFPKDNIDWLNWINQGKLIYGNKEKLQALNTQQRINVAEVSGQVAQSPLYEHCLESVSSILDKFEGVNDIFTDEHPGDD